VAVVPSLPSCLGGRVVAAVKLTAFGDFPPGPGQVVSAPPDGRAELRLPDGTRAVEVEAQDATGLVAFGRSATLSLEQGIGLASDGKLPVAFGPPDGLCALPSMHLVRSGHRATRLTSGRVLFSGGVDADGQAVTALELYLPLGDAATPPATFRVVAGGSVLEAVAALGQAVAALTDGGAIVTGGAPASSAGVADGPAYSGLTRHDADGVVTGPALILRGGQGRAFHSATTLSDGRVLLAGGCSALSAGACAAGQMLTSTVIYQPKTGQQTEGPLLRRPRFGHDAVLRGDGAVLLVGGLTDDGTEPPMELVDPDAARGFDVGNGTGHAALLNTGAVITVGASRVASIRTVLWLGTSDVETVGPLPAPVRGTTVTALDDGTILVAGGTDGTSLPTSTLLDRWGRPQKTIDYQRMGHTATRLLDGTVLLAGGAGPNQVVDGQALVYLRSPLGPWSSLAALGVDSTDDPLSPRRPSAGHFTNGHLELVAGVAGDGGRPSEVMLVAGAAFLELDLSLRLGQLPTGGGAALLLGWTSDADYFFVRLAPGQPAGLFRVQASAGRAGQSMVSTVAGCQGEALDASELPADPVLWSARWTDSLEVSSPNRVVLRCNTAPIRGQVGVGVLSGGVVIDALTISR